MKRNAARGAAVSLAGSTLTGQRRARRGRGRRARRGSACAVSGHVSRHVVYRNVSTTTPAAVVAQAHGVAVLVAQRGSPAAGSPAAHGAGEAGRPPCRVRSPTASSSTVTPAATGERAPRQRARGGCGRARPLRVGASAAARARPARGGSRSARARRGRACPSLRRMLARCDSTVFSARSRGSRRSRGSCAPRRSA